MSLIATLRFAWYLWRTEKFDGLGNRITLREAIALAHDKKFWEIRPPPQNSPL